MPIFRKPIGQKWLINILPGGTEMWLDEKCEAEWDTNFGLVIYHPDAKKTMTVVPQHAVVKVMSYGENEYRDRIRKLMGQPELDDAGNEIVEAEILEIEAKCSTS